MQTVGIRELKAKLSEHLRRVKRGEVLRVTDRGKVIAEIRPPAAGPPFADEEAGLRDLIARGIVREGLPHDPSVYRTPPWKVPAGTAQRLLDEDRGER
jgi:antitoxin (DNA-binding transcriptional repressor) of toxin-antitoxin stability system